MTTPPILTYSSPLDGAVDVAGRWLLGWRIVFRTMTFLLVVPAMPCACFFAPAFFPGLEMSWLRILCTLSPVALLIALIEGSVGCRECRESILRRSLVGARRAVVLFRRIIVGSGLLIVLLVFIAYRAWGGEGWITLMMLGGIALFPATALVFAFLTLGKFRAAQYILERTGSELARVE